MTAKKAFRLMLGVGLASLFVWLVLRQIRLKEVAFVLHDASAFWIGAALCAFSAAYACRIERWRLMLKRDSPNLTFLTCAGPFLACFAANNILPFRAGDMLRAFTFNHVIGTTSGVVLATLVVERLLDLLIVLLLLGAALSVFGPAIARFSGVSGILLLVLASTIITLLLFPKLFAPLVFAAGRLSARLVPKLSGEINHETTKCIETFCNLARGNVVLKLLLWSFSAWMAEGCVFWFAALALPSIDRPEASWLALPVGSLATLIPSTPGYVGTLDYFVLRSMTELDNEVAAAAAYALLVHALLWLPPTLVGGLYFLLTQTRPRRALKAPA